MENKAYRFGMLLFLFFLTGVLVAVSLYIGSVRISWKEIGSVLSGNSHTSTRSYCVENSEVWRELDVQ